MSTSAAIGRGTKSRWVGVYSYSDGYPTMQGRGLWFIYQTWFRSKSNGMSLFAKWATSHEWRTFMKANINLTPTYLEGSANERKREVFEVMGKGLPPECYCCGDGAQREGPSILTHKSTDGCQWGYVIVPSRFRMLVLKGAPGQWKQVASLDLHGAEPKWLDLECGKHQERCIHSAGYHGRSVVGADQYFAAWAALAEGWQAKEAVNVKDA